MKKNDITITIFSVSLLLVSFWESVLVVMSITPSIYFHVLLTFTRIPVTHDHSCRQGRMNVTLTCCTILWYKLALHQTIVKFFCLFLFFTLHLCSRYSGGQSFTFTNHMHGWQGIFGWWNNTDIFYDCITTVL